MTHLSNKTKWQESFPTLSTEPVMVLGHTVGIQQMNVADWSQRPSGQGRMWPGWLLQILPLQTHLKKTKGIFLVHFYIHQMQQPLNFFESHPTILVFVTTLEQITQPSKSESRRKHCMYVFVCPEVCACSSIDIPPLSLLPVSFPCQFILHTGLE